MPGSRPSATTSLPASVLWRDLQESLAALGTDLDIVDAGGGTGGFAVPLAEQGHRVLVVDPSPDSLASLARRAREAGVPDRVDGRQGDLSSLPAMLGPDAAVDALLCHAVLEVADDADDALAGAAAVVRPGGLVSVLVANRHAVVLARALAGRFEEASAVLADPAGRSGAGDRVLRRFDQAGLVALAERAGLEVQAVRGVRVFSDLVHGGVPDDPARRASLLELELVASRDPELLVVASSLHLLARRP